MEYRNGIRLFRRFLATAGTCVVPLYIRDADKGERFIGSSIYCKQENVELLFTARHVIEPVWPQRLWYPYSEHEPGLLPCDGFHFPTEKSEDFCVAELTRSLRMWSAFPYANIEAFATFKEYQHLLVGYPGSFTKRSTRTVQKLKLQGYLTGPAPESEYARLNVNPSKEFAVFFKKEKAYDENQSYTNFPDPDGMSGGAVFQFNENIPQLVSLVGIMTRWRKNVIIATRFETVRGLFSLKKIV